MGRSRIVGRPRVSPVLDESCELEFGPMRLTAKQIASRYQPIIRQRNTWRNQPSEMRYEVTEQASQYTIRYYVKWPDETHPIPLLNLIYRPFRTFYYGSAVDIETIQLSVDKKSGEISKVLFETEPEEGSNTFPSHERAILSHLDHEYALVIGNRKSTQARPSFLKGRIEILALTWNHEFAIQFSSSGTKALDLPLQLLTDDEYIALRYATRREANVDPFPRAVTRILLVCWFILSPVVIFLTLLRGKSE